MNARIVFTALEASKEYMEMYERHRDDGIFGIAIEKDAYAIAWQHEHKHYQSFRNKLYKMLEDKKTGDR